MTIRGLLDLLCEAFGQELNDAIFDRKTNDVHETLKILINGRHYSSLPGKLETRLQESDEIALFPAIAGGQRTRLLSMRSKAYVRQKQERSCLQRTGNVVDDKAFGCQSTRWGLYTIDCFRNENPAIKKNDQKNYAKKSAKESSLHFTAHGKLGFI